MIPVAPRVKPPTIVDANRDQVATALYLLALVALWSVLGRYWGIQHDALNYMLQAVATLEPNPLAGDLFLKYRSQEDFTVFPHLTARVVAWLGVDRAGALLTITAAVAFYAAAFGLWRRLLHGRMALLALGLLVALPGSYGAGGVFRFAEPFLTARTFSEALCLSVLLAWHSSRQIWAAALLVIAFLVHPLMAMPALLICIGLALPMSKVRHWACYGVLIVASAIMGSWLLMLPEPVMYGEWLELTRWRSGYLFLEQWTARDWETATQTLLTLACAPLVIPRGDIRKLVSATATAALAGLVLTGIAGELWHLRLLVEGQPWRWLWLARVVAVGVLPLIVASLWNRGRAGHAPAVLLCCAWLLTSVGSFSDLPPFGVGGVLCILTLALLVLDRWISAPTERVILATCWLALAMVVLTLISNVAVAFSNQFAFGKDPLWAQRCIDALRVPGVAAAVVVGAWATFGRARLVPMAMVVAPMAVLALIALPQTIRAWTDMPHGVPSQALFESWRKLIPPDAEVLWHEEPRATWFLLGRKSYLTVSQTAAVLFSREAALETQRRAQSLRSLVDPGVWFLRPSSRRATFTPLTKGALTAVCSESDASFVVSSTDSGDAVGVVEWPSPGQFVYLYDCNRRRQGLT
jgi:hypothetical protein